MILSALGYTPGAFPPLKNEEVKNAEFEVRHLESKQLLLTHYVLSPHVKKLGIKNTYLTGYLWDLNERCIKCLASKNYDAITSIFVFLIFNQFLFGISVLWDTFC